MSRLRWLKVAASLVPVLVLMVPFVAWYAYESPAMGMVLLAFLAASLAGSATVHVWATPLGGGRDLGRGSSQNIVVRIADTLSTFGWAGGCYLALQGSVFAAAGVAVGLIAPCVAWAMGQARREGR